MMSSTMSWSQRVLWVWMMALSAAVGGLAVEVLVVRPSEPVVPPASPTSVGATTPPTGGVEASSLVLRDAAGRARLLLMLGEAGEPRAAWLDESGTARLSAGLSSQGQPALAISDPTGAVRLSMAMREDGSVELALRDDQQSPRLVLNFDDAQRPRIVLQDAQQRPRGSWHLNEQGEGELVFYDALGNLFYRVP